MTRFIFIAFFSVFLLAACGGVGTEIADMYPNQDIVYDSNNNTSKIYRAYNTDIDTVVSKITQENEPESQGKKDNHVVLIYEDELVQVYQDSKDPDDVLIEVSSKKFVNGNYDSNFFLFYGLNNYHSYYNLSNSGSYRGYIGSNGKYIKNSGSNASIRFGSTSANSVRGGGPGAGK